MRAWIARRLIAFGRLLIGWGADVLGKPKTSPADPERDERERLENDRLFLAGSAESEKMLADIDREIDALVKREREADGR